MSLSKILRSIVGLNLIFSIYMLVNKVMRLFRYGFSQFYVRQLCFFLLLGIVLKDLNELSKKSLKLSLLHLYI